MKYIKFFFHLLMLLEKANSQNHVSLLATDKKIKKQICVIFVKVG